MSKRRTMRERSGVERRNPLGNHANSCAGKKKKGYVLLKFWGEARAKQPSEVVSARISREKDRPEIFRRDPGPTPCTIRAEGRDVRALLRVEYKRVVCCFW
jgi:hypothetical protein